MKALIAFERSGKIRREFRKLGHEAYSADLCPADDCGEHILCDHDLHILDIICQGDWDLVIAHPECTYLSSSGLHWNYRTPGRVRKTEEALRMVGAILHARVKKLALENPIGCISTKFRKPDQIIQPWQFGHDASKATCLWLKNLPLLTPTNRVAPRIVNGKQRWSNQTDSGQNRLGLSEERSYLRAITYEGIALAMAEQWGGLSLNCDRSPAVSRENQNPPSLSQPSVDKEKRL